MSTKCFAAAAFGHTADGAGKFKAWVDWLKKQELDNVVALCSCAFCFDGAGDYTSHEETTGLY